MININYKTRRAALLKQMLPNSLAILPAATIQLRNNDVEWPFRQNSDFYYLTGLVEADAIAVYEKLSDTESTFTLFVQSADFHTALWTGPRVTTDEACNVYGADKSFEVALFTELLPKLLQNKTIVYYPLQNCTVYRQVRRALQSQRKQMVQQYIDLPSLVAQLRLYKDAEEIKLLEHAATISAKAHADLMHICKPELYAYELEGKFLQYAYQNGCRSLAYQTIVGSGETACVLHYTKNQQPLLNGELVLVDAGIEYNYYAADITRTYPVSGKFSSVQRDIYQLVLQAQLAGIAAAKPGNEIIAIQNAILQVFVPGLIDLGILSGDVEELKTQAAYREYYPHSSGHFLGLDVHDPGRSLKLESGMVLTVEPGLYFSKYNTKIPVEYRSIGIRIEDDILITDNGHKVLSNNAPKTIDEIETWMLI